MVFRLLTDRQGEFLRRLCRGERVAEITEAMKIRYYTYESYRANIRIRLGKASMTEICQLVESNADAPVVLARPVFNRRRPRYPIAEGDGSDEV